MQPADVLAVVNTCPDKLALCRYVSGDPRFKSYSKSNPRKMVKMWAEKELRNLARLHAAGILCPKPLQLRMHVLVMEFIGQNGIAALRLKVYQIPPYPSAAAKEAPVDNLQPEMPRDWNYVIERFCCSLVCSLRL